MFVHYRTLGLILAKEDRGEADQLFKIYTKDFGKLEILGKAIRKISSKLRSGAEMFYLSEIEFIQGKIYKTLTDAILIEKFQNLRKDLERLDTAQKISEDLDNFVKGGEPDEKIWQLLIETFEKLNNYPLSAIHCLLLYYYFFWNLLSILGYRPELYNCLFCQKRLKPEKLYFSFKDGGVICQNCFKKVKSDIIEINPDTVKVLRIILKKGSDFVFKIKIEKHHLKVLKIVSEKYYFYLKNSF